MFFKDEHPYNRKLGELCTVDHQRLEHPENTEEFEKEMRNIRSILFLYRGVSPKQAD